MNRLERIVVPGIAALAWMAGSAAGVTVDLSTSPSGTINGALFQQFSVEGAGTGAIESFLRVQNNPIEQGYNTSGRPAPFDDRTDPNFTHNVRFSDLVTRTVGGTSYYEFLLDTNEPNGGGANLISLDQLKIFTSPTGSQTTTSVDSLGTLRYNLDAGADSWVIVNDTRTHGSGETDARILIPTSLFAGTLPTDFVYLFARLGDNVAADNAQGGFEEFALQRPNLVPLPTACAMGFLGLFSVAGRRSRR